MAKVVHTTGLERIELERLRNGVDRLLTALQEAAEEVTPSVPGAWSPSVDLCESSEAITVYVELPGLSAEQIEVVLTTTQLHVSGKKKKRARGNVISHLCSERSYGHFSRVVPLRWPVRLQEATATLHNGILIVHLPKLVDRRGAKFKIPVEEVTMEK